MAYCELHKASHDRRITAKYWMKSKTLSLDDRGEVQHCIWEMIGDKALERKIHPPCKLEMMLNEHRWGWAQGRCSVTSSNHCQGGFLGECSDSNNRKVPDQVTKELIQTTKCDHCCVPVLMHMWDLFSLPKQLEKKHMARQIWPTLDLSFKNKEWI